VKKNVRLTSPSYYRDVFHIELEPRDPHHQLNYLPGMVLNIYPKNNPPRVDVLLEGLGVDGQEFVSRRYKVNPLGDDVGWGACSSMCKLQQQKNQVLNATLATQTREGVGMEEVNTVRHYLCNVLDIFGCPKPSFYRTLAEYTGPGSPGAVKRPSRFPM
jgi:sulfite reductase alpha subunit-like flavoprotein